MFLYQHFSFPLSVTFHQIYIIIHSSITHAVNVSLPKFQCFPCQYHSTNAPWTFIHVPPTLYNISLRVIQFSPVSTIPPNFHSHPFTYHQRCIMFLSKLQVSLSVRFHQRSIYIYCPTTQAVYCFSPNTSFFPCQYHPTNAPYTFILLTPTLYNVSLSKLHFFKFHSTIAP